MKKTRMITTAMLLMSVTALTGVIQAGSEDEARELYKRIYDKALTDLETGNSEQKVLAAYRFGTSGNQRFVRPLARELLRDLGDENLERLPVNDPYVKTQMAWALGRIGHKQALPDLLKALEISVKIAEGKVKKNEEKRSKLAQSKDMYPVVLDHDRPGPARLKPGFRFPDSPDVYWSVADAFKEEGGINYEREDHRTKSHGYNTINLIQEIMKSIGLISGEYSKIVPTGKAGEPLRLILGQSRDALKSYINHPLAEIRGAAVLSLGRMYDREAVSLLEARYAEEKDLVVKTQILRAVLWNDRSKTNLTRELIEMLQSNDVGVRLESARALRDIALGETIFYINQAISIEDDPRVRNVLQDALYFAEVDNILPVNY